MVAAYVRAPWRGCITIQGLWRRVTSSSSRDGHNSATWTPVLGTTRRPRARDTLMLFYKHCCPMGPLLQTLTTPRSLSDQSVELSVPRRPRGSVGREMEECGSALSLSASNTGAGGHQSRSPSLDTLSAPGHSWLATGHHRDSQLSSVCVSSKSCPSVLRL